MQNHAEDLVGLASSREAAEDLAVGAIDGQREAVGCAGVHRDEVGADRDGVGDWYVQTASGENHLATGQREEVANRGIIGRSDRHGLIGESTRVAGAAGFLNPGQGGIGGEG